MSAGTLTDKDTGILDPQTVFMDTSVESHSSENPAKTKAAMDKAAMDKAALEKRVRSLRIQGESRPVGMAIRFVTWAGWAAACATLSTSLILGWVLYRGKSEPLAVREPSETNKPQSQPQNSTSKETRSPNISNPNPNQSSSTESKPSDPDAPALVSSGYIIPIHQIQVSPKVSGMIVKLNFEEGMTVSKGYILAELETIEYDADLSKTTALLAEAKQKLAELKSGARPEEIRQAKLELDECVKQREQAKLDYDRTKRLTGQSALSARELETSQYSYEAIDRRTERLRTAFELIVKGPREERIRAAEAQVQSFEADRFKAQWRLDNCKVKAPVTGIILSKKAEEGNMVNPAGFNVSANLCEMADLTQLEVDLTIQERDFAKIKGRMECLVMPEAYRNSKEFLTKYPKGYKAYISRAMPQADRAKGAIPVRVKVDVPSDEQGIYLKPDMRVEVTFFEKQRPESAK